MVPSLNKTFWSNPSGWIRFFTQPPLTHYDKQSVFWCVLILQWRKNVMFANFEAIDNVKESHLCWRKSRGPCAFKMKVTAELHLGQYAPLYLSNANIVTSVAFPFEGCPSGLGNIFSDGDQRLQVILKSKRSFFTFCFWTIQSSMPRKKSKGMNKGSLWRDISFKKQLQQHPRQIYATLWRSCWVTCPKHTPA